MKRNIGGCTFCSRNADSVSQERKANRSKRSERNFPGFEQAGKKYSPFHFRWPS